MAVLIVLAVLLLAMGVVVLVGKGDNLIAGYNTASPEEKGEYGIRRLRVLFGGLLLALAPMTLILLWEDTMAALGVFIALVLVSCIAVAVLANTWAKRKQ